MIFKAIIQAFLHSWGGTGLYKGGMNLQNMEFSGETS